MGGDAEARLGGRSRRLRHGVSRVAREALGKLCVALLYGSVGAYGERGEDDPAGRVAHEALGLVDAPLPGVGHLHVLIAVVHARGRADDHGAAQLLGEGPIIA